MNREIKFRGKSSVTNEWIYGSLVKIGDKSHIIRFDEAELDGHHLSYCSDRPIFTIQETIGQFTGLKDKNGNEIYGGDIVNRNGYNYFVKFLSGMFYASIEECHNGISGGFPLYSLTDNEGDVCEIIGNKFDNPELLK